MIEGVQVSVKKHGRKSFKYTINPIMITIRMMRTIEIRWAKLLFRGMYSSGGGAGNDMRLLFG